MAQFQLLGIADTFSYNISIANIQEKSPTWMWSLTAPIRGKYLAYPQMQGTYVLIVITVRVAGMSVTYENQAKPWQEPAA